jgi:aldehyde:ferredoxin oxidoreductase
MALSFGTSPIGAHHKDAWVISYEISETDRDAYDTLKADKVIELQRIRGGMFETLTTCRFPWIEVGYDEENYPKFLKQVTGNDHWDLEEVYSVGDRVYNLIRAFWVREHEVDGTPWNREYDFPPAKWFDEKLGGTGPHAGKHLDRQKYGELLNYYYDRRGWDHRGIPKKETLSKYDLSDVRDQLTQYIQLN